MFASNVRLWVIPNRLTQIDLVRRCCSARGCARARTDKGANPHTDRPAERADDSARCSPSCSATFGSVA